MDDAQFIPEKKSEPVEEVAEGFGLDPAAIRWGHRHFVGWTGGSEPWMPVGLLYSQRKVLRGCMEDTAHLLYAQAVSKPHGVNDPVQPDYALIAKECVEKAKATTPYLLMELGLLPKEGE